MTLLPREAKITSVESKSVEKESVTAVIPEQMGSMLIFGIPARVDSIIFVSSLQTVAYA